MSSQKMTPKYWQITWTWCVATHHYYSSLDAELYHGVQVCRDVNIAGTEERRRALFLLWSLAKSAQVVPQCYWLTGVEIHGTPVTRGGFSEIYKENYGSQTVCVKVFYAQEVLRKVGLSKSESLIGRHTEHP